jgi:hypothetical protein
VHSCNYIGCKCILSLQHRGGLSLRPFFHAPDPRVVLPGRHGRFPLETLAPASLFPLPQPLPPRGSCRAKPSQWTGGGGDLWLVAAALRGSVRGRWWWLCSGWSAPRRRSPLRRSAAGGCLGAGRADEAWSGCVVALAARAGARSRPSPGPIWAALLAGWRRRDGGSLM